MLLALMFHGLGWGPLEPDGRLSFRYVVGISVLDSVIVVSLAVLFLASRGERWQDVFFGGRRHGREIAVGIALAYAAGRMIRLEQGRGLRPSFPVAP